MAPYLDLKAKTDSALDGIVGSSGILKGRTLWQMTCYLAWEVEVKDRNI